MAPGGPDVLVWVVRGHADGRLRPEMFGWVDADTDGRIVKVLVKEPPDDPATCPLIVGAFTFRRAADYQRCCERLIARDGRVNGEFYVDSLIDDAVAIGLNCRTFEIDHYLGWGTPNDLQTFEYWQSCFHKWPSHPYSIFQDRRIPSSATAELDKRYRAVKQLPPTTLGDGASMGVEKSARGVAISEGVRFLPIGVGAVLIDFLAYTALIRLGLDPTISKAASFVLGAFFAFVGNRYYTFKRSSGPRGFMIFGMVYVISLILNVATNHLALDASTGLGAVRWQSLSLAFVAATGVSATSNFFGMKTLVFRGRA